MEKRLDGNYTKMLQAILNKSWRQQPTKQQLYGHQPPITKIIKIRQTRHAGHCWRSRDELISDVLSWTPSHGRAKAGQQQLCVDTWCSPEDPPEVMNDRKGWWERVRDIQADCTTTWLNPIWLFDAKIWFICKYLIIILTILLTFITIIFFAQLAWVVEYTGCTYAEG